MADNYYAATGVLVLDRVTPVITALFGAFNLDASHPGDGRAYIAHSSDSDPQWSDVADGLADLAAHLDLLAPSDDEPPTMESLLNALSKHFGAEQNATLQQLIRHQSFDDEADLETLRVIAGCFDDGHHLIAIEIEGCWSCSKPRLFEFGGNGRFLSQELSLVIDSSHALVLGEELHTALRADDVEATAVCIARETRNLLASIHDPALLARVRARAIEHLLADSASHD